ncbi:protein kinase superfamily protein isoform X2 [Wolffia australiana]
MNITRSTFLIEYLMFSGYLMQTRGNGHQNGRTTHFFIWQKRYPTDPKHYELYEEIGEGISATVYMALCVPLNDIVAIKVIDLEKCDNDIDGIMGEVRTMSLTNHPNLLHAHCSFTSGTNLWVVMPFLSGGSCLHIMRFAYPGGFEESVIATLLREVLKALVYLHSQGYIHRDVKAGNILLGGNGVVKLADFGVSACMFDSGTRQRTRKSFVGTPCWMAPEVMEKTHGYDFKADIWSFGITALELAHGHAPLSKYPPMKVVLLTLQNAPPGLLYDRARRFSKTFREMITACLVKDPAKRPSAEKLLKHGFFKNARSCDFLARAILSGLSPLGKRFKEMKEKDAELLLQNQEADEDKHPSQKGGYMQGLSGWNFDLNELKAQAAIDENLDVVSITEDLKKQTESGNSSGPNNLQSDGVSCSKLSDHGKEESFGGQDVEDSLAFSFPMVPLRALKGCFDVCEEEITPSIVEVNNPAQSYVSESMNLRSEMHGGVNPEGCPPVPLSTTSSELSKDFQPSVVPAQDIDDSKGIIGDVLSDDQERVSAGRNSNLPIPSRLSRDVRTQLESTSQENLEKRVVQQKGRFRITSADVLPKSDRLAKGDTVSGVGTGPLVFPGFVISILRQILQQTGMQKEQLKKLIKHIDQNPGANLKLGEASKSEVTQAPFSSAWESNFQSYIVHLQRCNTDLAEELHRTKSQNALLERELGSLLSKKGGQRS